MENTTPETVSAPQESKTYTKETESETRTIIKEQIKEDRVNQFS